MTATVQAPRRHPPGCPLPGMTRGHILWALFLEWFKLSLFIVGGGYAIITAADTVFGRDRKWLEEGELLDHLPIFQAIPGLIAGNAAIYVGMKVAGFVGSVLSLVAIALPSMIIITAIAMGFAWLPMDHPGVQGAFIGLRSAFCGIVLAAMIKSWPRIMRGGYARLVAPLTVIAIIGWQISAQTLILGALVFGVLMFTVFIPLTDAIRRGRRPG